MAAEDLALITDVVAGAEEVSAGGTVTADSVCLPIANLGTFSAGNDGKELCLALLEAVNAAVNGATSVTKMTTTSSQAVTDADTLRKTYNFVVQVGYDLDNLNVEAE